MFFWFSGRHGMRDQTRFCLRYPKVLVLSSKPKIQELIFKACSAGYVQKITAGQLGFNLLLQLHHRDALADDNMHCFSGD